jgi:hypothetical protein
MKCRTIHAKTIGVAPNQKFSQGRSVLRPSTRQMNGIHLLVVSN